MSTPDPIDYYPTIKDFPCSDRPRERLIREGATALSTAELLAIIFRAGVGGENVISLSQRCWLYGGLPLARAPSRPARRTRPGGAQVAPAAALNLAAGWPKPRRKIASRSGRRLMRPTC
jgi:DNA repair protein RadC